MSISRKIAVFGLGYVGAVTAACLARLGHRVTGIDRDPFKVESLKAGKAPFYEPGLEQIIRETVAAGGLSASLDTILDTTQALAEADVAMVCVGTPSGPDGNLSLHQVRRVCEDIALASAGRVSRLIVAIRSTVFPGACEEVATPVFSGAPVSVVSNPEFLREGAAIHDFLHPSLLVVGGDDPEAANLVADLYRSLDVEACVVSLRTAEMIKHACNAFHAVKVSFANEVGALSAELGADGAAVMDVLCRDTRLNTSPAYLRPGFPFGGSCLPKDLRALNWQANRLDVAVPLLASALASNAAHLDRAVRSVMNLGPVRIGIFGLAFEEDTDDLRESPAVKLVELLIQKGREIRIFDPHIRVEKIYGSNRDFLMNAIPHISALVQPRLESLLDWADAVVLTQEPSPDTANAIQSSGRRMLNLAVAPAPES
jgi:GDP-mannose 6-dehydrogenase